MLRQSSSQVSWDERIPSRGTPPNHGQACSLGKGSSFTLAQSISATVLKKCDGETTAHTILLPQSAPASKEQPHCVTYTLWPCQKVSGPLSANTPETNQASLPDVPRSPPPLLDRALEPGLHLLRAPVGRRSRALPVIHTRRAPPPPQVASRVIRTLNGVIGVLD